MKKGTIIGIAVGVPVLAVGICALTAPGLPYWLLTKAKCPNINEIYAELPDTSATKPDDFSDYEANGISFSAPSALHLRYSEEEIAEQEPGSIYDGTFITDDNNLTVIVSYKSGNAKEGFVQSSSYAELTEGAVVDLLESMDAPFAGWYDYYSLLHRLTLDDFPMHSLQQAKAFYKLAQAKEAMYYNPLFPPYEAFYELETEHGIGFITKPAPDENHAGETMLIAEIYERTAPDSGWMIIVRSTDAETAWQIVRSIDVIRAPV